MLAITQHRSFNAYLPLHIVEYRTQSANILQTACQPMRSVEIILGTVGVGTVG